MGLNGQIATKCRFVVTNYEQQVGESSSGFSSIIRDFKKFEFLLVEIIIYKASYFNFSQFLLRFQFRYEII